MKQPIKIIIADDHHIMLDGLAALIKATHDIEVTGIAYNGKHALQLVKQHPEVDIAVLDIEMPVMDGIEATKKMRAQYPSVKVLVLTMHKDESFIRGIIEAGASGYILKKNSGNELVNAIRAVQAGEEYFSKSVTDVLIQGIQKRPPAAPPTKLTNREKQVLCLIGEGMTTKEMSAELCIADATIETYRRNLLDKLGMKNSKGLVRYAVENRYLRE